MKSAQKSFLFSAGALPLNPPGELYDARQWSALGELYDAIVRWRGKNISFSPFPFPSTYLVS